MPPHSPPSITGQRLVAALFLFSCLPATARDVVLTITSDPPAATVTWNGAFVGYTPYLVKLPGGYFHDPNWVVSKHLGVPVTVVLSKPGYAPKRLDLTAGPFVLVNGYGQYFGQYWLFTNTAFHQVLSPDLPLGSFQTKAPVPGGWPGYPQVAANFQFRSSITFLNGAGKTALVKLIGPFPRTTLIPENQSRRESAIAPGRYYILVRYGDREEDYTYTRGDPFVIEESAGRWSEMSITLYTVPDGNYGSKPSRKEEFERGQ